MKLDPNNVYAMPLIMGPLFRQDDRPRRVYTSLESLSLQYRSEPAAIRNLLPACYTVGADPVVNVSFSDYDGVDLMAGRGYRIVSISVAARFDGDQDHLDGDYVLVIYEDHTIPIIGGREQLGVPKVFADISAIRPLPDGRFRCEASLWGHLLLSIEVVGLEAQPADAVKEFNTPTDPRPALCYKYIPSYDGPPDADYPTLLVGEAHATELWRGQHGQLVWGSAQEEDIGYGARIVHALRSLPVHDIVAVTRTRGSSVLRNDLCRRLR